MDYTPILSKNLDVSKIRYGPLKKTSLAKSVYVNYGGEKLVIQFPLMHIPYGISDSSDLNKDKKDGAKIPNYTMNVSFKGMDDNKAIKNLFEKIQEIEEKIKKDVFANRVTWLNDRYDDMEAVVSRLFSSNMQFDKDKETKKVLNRYPPTFRVKVPSASTVDDEGIVNTIFKFDSSDMENNELNFAEIISKLKGAKCQIIVQLMGLWFAGGKYGCTWKVMSGRFQAARGVKYNYVEDSDDDAPSKEEDEEDDDDLVADAVEEDIPSPPPAPKKGTKPSAPPPPPVTYVAPSDDEEEEEAAEEEEEEEEEEEPTPPPPPPKKTVKKVVVKK